LPAAWWRQLRANLGNHPALEGVAEQDERLERPLRLAGEALPKFAASRRLNVLQRIQIDLLQDLRH
jgi:hypothetical protein